MSLTPEEKLIKEGWEKQATYDDPRLSEMVEMYAEIGFEVRLEPINTDSEIGCTSCIQLKPDLFKTIFTRRKGGTRNDEKRVTSDE
jgi:hypothetical protein